MRLDTREWQAIRWRNLVSVYKLARRKRKSPSANKMRLWANERLQANDWEASSA